MTKERISPCAVQLIKDHQNDICHNEYLPVIQEAIEKDVLEQVLDAFFEAGYDIPTELVFHALCSAFDPSPDDKRKAIHFMNKQQIFVFKAMLG